MIPLFIIGQLIGVGNFGTTTSFPGYGTPQDATVGSFSSPGYSLGYSGSNNGGLYIASSITASNNYTLNTIVPILQTTGSVPFSTITAYVYSDSGSKPGTVLTGGTGSTLNVSTLTSSPASASFTGFNASITSGSVYWCVLSASAAGDASDYVGWGKRSSYNPTPDILWWKGNTGTGTVDTATVGPNCNLSSSNMWGTTFTGTNTGGSSSDLIFNGTSYFASSSANITYGTNIVTVEFRVSQSNYSTSTIQEYIDSNDGANNSFAIINDINSNTAAFRINMSDGVGNFGWYSFPRPSTGVWHHIACVVDNSAAVAPLAYVDGISQTVTLVFEQPRTSFTSFSTANLFFGAYHNGPTRFCPSLMKDLRIYSGARSSTLILQDATNYP